MPESKVATISHKVDRCMPYISVLVLLCSLSLQKVFTIDTSIANTLHNSYISLAAYLCYCIFRRLDVPLYSSPESSGKK
ncbi:hypothetical protein BOTCAL_0342g00030 [Botryotinia calthae]|uniref:Uncharacterized protein n=1 Tax=Botryotinia calthae TaxID=38488 RepID=A0A4Y8CTN7_9HELO|nr:hypothetical protein BOTCAL_0342g00030 [Botryotinia calthae]